MLFMLKGLSVPDISHSGSTTTVIQIVDELPYYAHEVEKKDQSSDSPLVEVLDEMDRVNRHHARTMRIHWTHMRNSPTSRGNDEYLEGGNCNFLALAIQARLVKYVRSKLDSDLKEMEKHGRPLLDYALRPRRVTPITMSYHSQREETSIDVEMTKKGADPNQKVYLNDGRTVWALFLLSCYESSQRGEASMQLKKVWYEASKLLILHGAAAACWFDNNLRPLIVLIILDTLFGADKATSLQKLMEEVKQTRPQKS